jgi:hypothetical protein
MRTAIVFLAIAFLAVSPAAVSAKTVPPVHHSKGIHGASSYAPGHVKKRKNLQSARTVAVSSWQPVNLFQEVKRFIRAN